MFFNLVLIIVNILLYMFLNSTKRLSKKQKNTLFLIIAFIIFAILMASRDFNTGSDTKMYIRTFLTFSQNKWNSTIWGGYFEPLYAILNILLSYVSQNPRIIIVATSFVISYSFYKFIKDNSENYLLSVLIFIGLLFFYTSMNTIRQFMALSVILLGFKFVKNKKIIPFLITILIAYLFHSSALVGLLLYPMYNMKYTHTRVLIIFAIAIVANVFVSDLINYIYQMIGRINYYDSRVGQENIANLIYMIIYLVMFLFSLFEIKKNKSDYSKKGFNLYVFVISSAISLIAMNMNILARVTTYFNVFSIICLPNIIEDNIKKINNKVVVNSIVVLFLILYSSTIIKYRPEWNTAFDYRSCIIKSNENICSY